MNQIVALDNKYYKIIDTDNKEAEEGEDIPRLSPNNIPYTLFINSDGTMKSNSDIINILNDKGIAA